ncbi:hypothetical protein [Metabacillus fastidiosus]|uniref:hypothetical protein n=1 Tax=Metabacillus fastidiosus TaxID=1458 RepID=UPI000824D158|nr:hypothetical protein [Metabacillus fastidiosus]MED4461158.1 hypothetical protein [Metabacillus fastidiosus]
MSVQKEKEYVLYKNLKFIWDKKAFLIIIPLLICLLTGAVSYFISDHQYVGKAVFYTAKLKEETLTEPDLMDTKYRAENKNVEVNFSVPQNKRVQIKVTGDKKADVEKELQSLSEKYNADLMANYKLRYDLTETDMKAYKKQLKKVEKSLQPYYKKVEAAQGGLPETDLLLGIATKEELIHEYLTSVNRMNTELKLFDEPKLNSTSIEKSDNYFIQNAFIALVISFFFTLFGLMLWRYTREARGELNNG